MLHEPVPVVIVGAGPVGLTLSLELSRYRVRHVLISRNDEPTPHPKCNTTNARSMEHFRRLGVADALRRQGLPADCPTDIVYLNRLAGFEITRLRMPSAAAILAGAGDERKLTPEPLHRISQRYLEPILLAAARASDYSDIRLGCELTSLTQQGDRVTLSIVDRKTGATEQLAANWLVGCDGARSLVRSILAIELAGESAAHRAVLGGPMVSTFFRSPALAKALPKERGFLYWTVNPELRSLTFSIDGDALFLNHYPVKSDADPSTFADVFPRIAGCDLDAEILSSERWYAGYSLIADRYRSGRVLLAGDAAHLLTPTGGFGMNTGIDDAANLGWKLAAAEQGWGGHSLLDSYAAERRPIARRNSRAAKDIADRIGNIPIPAEMESRSDQGDHARAALAETLRATFTHHFDTIGVQLGARYDDSPIIVGDGSAPPTDHPNRYLPSTCAGGRAPHIELTPRDALFDRFGVGFSLVTTSGAATDPIERAAKARGVPLEIIELEEAVSNGVYDKALTLIRPDQHVAWRGDVAPLDAIALIDRVRGAL